MCTCEIRSQLTGGVQITTLCAGKRKCSSLSHNAPPCASITDQSSRCSLWTSSKCLYMCVCASDSGTADFREGLLADGQGLTQINTLGARAHHIYSSTVQTCCFCRSFPVWVFVWVLGFCVCAVADGDELLTCVCGR